MALAHLAWLLADLLTSTGNWIARHITSRRDAYAGLWTELDTYRRPR